MQDLEHSEGMEFNDIIEPNDSNKDDMDEMILKRLISISIVTMIAVEIL